MRISQNLAKQTKKAKKLSQKAKAIKNAKMAKKSAKKAKKNECEKMWRKTARVLPREAHSESENG